MSRGPRRAWERVLALAMLVGSLALWSFDRVVRSGPDPAVAVLVPGGLFQLCLDRGAIHMLAMRDPGMRLSGVRWKRVSTMGKTGYHWGIHVEALGFAAALLTAPFSGSDYVVLPHAALAIPLWLVAVVSLVMLWIGAPGRRRVS